MKHRITDPIIGSFKNRKRHRSGLDHEKKAIGYLQQQGLQMVAPNYYCRFGEIDLIMRHNEWLVFIEVRARTNMRFGGAEASLTPSKQKKLVVTARHFLQRYNHNGPMRFDLVAFNNEKINWIQNAFTLNE